MFQYSRRFFELSFRAWVRIARAWDFEGLVEIMQELELLVRTEKDTVELERMIEQASGAFGVAMEDYLHE